MISPVDLKASSVFASITHKQRSARTGSSKKRACESRVSAFEAVNEVVKNLVQAKTRAFTSYFFAEKYLATEYQNIKVNSHIKKRGEGEEGRRSGDGYIRIRAS